MIQTLIFISSSIIKIRRRYLCTFPYLSILFPYNCWTQQCLFTSDLYIELVVKFKSNFNFCVWFYEVTALLQINYKMYIIFIFPKFPFLKYWIEILHADSATRAKLTTDWLTRSRYWMFVYLLKTYQTTFNLTYHTLGWRLKVCPHIGSDVTDNQSLITVYYTANKSTSTNFLRNKRFQILEHSL